ncbi:Recombinase [Eubacterium pyruvativorans]|nr:Recombinase [Eubacterium pyruvativorans]
MPSAFQLCFLVLHICENLIHVAGMQCLYIEVCLQRTLIILGVDDKCLVPILTGAGNTKWYDSTINKILRNEKYMGDALLQKTVTTDFLAKKRVKNTKRLFLDKLEFT